MVWEGLDRRNFPRIIYPCLVKIRSTDNNQDATLTHTENIGIGGICVIVKKNIAMFTEVDIEIDLIDVSEHVRTLGRVVWTVHRNHEEKHKPMHYDIGIEFVDMKPKDKERLTQLLNQMVKKGSKLLRPYV